MDNILFQKEVFADRLQRRRIACGYKSQAAFAKAFNICFRNGAALNETDAPSGILGTIKNYENPKHTGMPRLDIVVEMCQLLNCEIDFLLGKIEEPKHIHQEMLDQCGLSNAATDQLVYWKTHGTRYTEMLNHILTSANFDHALYHASEVIRAKPAYIDLVEIYNEWTAKTYSQPRPADGYPSGEGLRGTLERAETKYEIERLRLNEYLTYLASELEDISIKKKQKKGSQ